MISNTLAQVGAHTEAIEPNLVRHMVINTIRSLKTKYGREYGEMVIAADSRSYWRREFFPQYKGTRKADREKSDIDWHALFDTLNLIKEEIKDNFPYRVVQVDGAEADDVIATLVMEQREPLNTGEKILILSGDKDFVQLQKYPDVFQHDPVRKKDIKADDPVHFLEHLVLAGDRGDGVPNVLSPDNCLVEGIRQKSLRETKINQILNQSKEDLPEDIRRNWARNRLMIDLSFIPQHVRSNVVSEYDSQKNKPRNKLFNYFIAHKMKLMMECINEF
jgi:5'-3' exonuclease